MESWIALEEHDNELILTSSDGIVSRNITGYETPFRHEGLHLFFQTTHAQLVTTIANPWREEGRGFGELWADSNTSFFLCIPGVNKPLQHHHLCHLFICMLVLYLWTHCYYTDMDEY